MSKERIKIDKKIIDSEVVHSTPTLPDPTKLKDRPRVVEGKTYKIKPPNSAAALYITINDLVLDDGTRHPIEVFINTKDASHQQWITGLTRMISAVFRSAPSISFVFEELQQVFDPLGGYWSNGRRMNSIVAHIGAILHEHVYGHPDPRNEELDSVYEEAKQSSDGSSSPALLCPSCQQYGAKMMDGCLTCLLCGHSKCE